MFFVAALVICLIIKFRFPKEKSIARIIDCYLVVVNSDCSRPCELTLRDTKLNNVFIYC